MLRLVPERRKRLLVWYGVGEKDGSDWDLGIFGVNVGVGGLLNLERAVLCLVAGFFLEFVRGLVSSVDCSLVFGVGGRDKGAVGQGV